jgi:hypothetical protein
VRRLLLTAIIAAALTAPVQAQGQLLEATAGAATGLVGGVVVTLGWVVEQATFENRYLHSLEDLVSYTGTPVVVGPAIGVSLALIDEELMWRVTGGGAVGFLAGTALGATLGQLIEGNQRGRWAGGTMGAAAGLLAGAATMLILERDTLLGEDDPLDRGVPVGVRLRF